MRDNFLEELKAELNGRLLLGREVNSAQPAYLSLDDLKETSVHIVGGAGYGKSYYLRHLIDQLVVHHQPFGVIDPHREIFQYAVWRLRRAGVSPRRIVLVDPGDERYAVGFNPLACGLDDPGEAASMVLEAFLKAWGAESFDKTPRLEGILRGTFRLLIESRLTLLEAFDLLNVDNVGFRRALRERVTDRLVREDWLEHEKLSKSDKITLFESSRNRVRRVLEAAQLQWMLARTENTLDFGTILDQGTHLLANLGGVNVQATQRLIGALLVNGIFHAAKRRNSRRRRDWFLICDEFGEFATRDFANSLDQLRKFGVHLILAHQRLQQLEREDPDVLSAVMTNAKIKVVFGGLERPEADRMARELFTGDVSGDRLKHVAYQTKFRPVAGTFEVNSESSSESEGESEGSGSSQSEMSGLSALEGESSLGDDYDIATRSRSRSDQSSSSSGKSASRGRSRARSSSHSRSVVPITRHEEFQEETSRQFRSLDEEWERMIGLVHRLGKREVLIKIYNRPVHHVRTPDVEPERVDTRLENFRTKVLDRCPYTKPVEDVVIEIEARREEVTAMVKASEKPPLKSFRE